MSTALVLLRRDLRLEDNPALHAACAEHERVLPVYVHAPDEEAPWQPGAASQWWLHRSLQALDDALARQNGRLCIARGETLDVTRALIREFDAVAVFWNRRYEPAAIASDTKLKAGLRTDGIAVESRSGNLWCEPWQIATEQGDPYRVFTPFWRKLRTRLQPDEPLPAARAREWVLAQGSLPLSALNLLPKIAWDTGFDAAWRPGEAGAAEMLGIFADDALNDYKTVRDLPARHGTSRLSPHLHFGEITPRQIHHRLHVCASGDRRRPDLEPYLRELAWREFAHHLLYHFPNTPDENFNPRFDRFRWANDDPGAIRNWQRGQTGIPLVDAGMRELWTTGWMHNRVRMVAASWLSKNLRQHWRHGARWFWDTLVDADLANNTLGWQWVAGTGADAAPYFRIFNPVLQAKRFDPEGIYVRRWLPELTGLPDAVLQTPWQQPELLRRIAPKYPRAPIVDLAASREMALAAYQELRKAP